MQCGEGFDGDYLVADIFQLAPAFDDVVFGREAIAQRGAKWLEWVLQKDTQRLAGGYGLAWIDPGLARIWAGHSMSLHGRHSASAHHEWADAQLR